MTTTGTPDRTIENWATITVTALPTGWRNVYRNRDGSVFAWPCPVILVQELRSTTAVTDVVDADGYVRVQTHTDPCPAPYETRAVFGCTNEYGRVEPATDISNYVATIAPGQDLTGFAEEVAA